MEFCSSLLTLEGPALAKIGGSMHEGTKMCSFCLLLGRICLSALFIMAGIGKFLDYDQTTQYMVAKGFTMVPLFLVVSGAIEIIGGLSLLLGYRIRYGALLLILFMIPTTLLFSAFWSYEGLEARLQFIQFLKNVSVIGGLLYVLSVGAGKFSFDSCCGCKPTSCCK
jgi:putative oxidoreductase